MIRYLRKRLRTISLSLSLTMIINIFNSFSVAALSTGPEQVEFSSYEDAGASDMVDLITGDYNFTMPLLEVPGPEGSFTIPLFYHAGITPEQDASWTGLGFNLNVGCITRNIVSYADDAFDEPLSITAKDPGGEYWVKNYLVYKRTWDSQKGYGGGISLFNIIGADWQNSGGLKSGTVLGLNFNKSGVRGYWAENVMNVGSTIISLAGGISSATGAASKSIAVDAAMSAVQMGSSLYQGYLSQGTFSSTQFDWDVSTKVSHMGFKMETKYWLDDTRTELAFGALYLGSTEKSTVDSPYSPPDYNSPTGTNVGTDYPRLYTPSQGTKVSKGFKRGTDQNRTSSDMQLTVLPGEKYHEVVRANHIAYDQFNVMTSGVAGAISPYRLEMGSVAQPKRYTFITTPHNLIPFVEEDNEANKVQFNYNGQFANNYTHHDDATFGIDHSVYESAGKNYLRYTVTNSKLLGGNRTEIDASRIKNKKVVSGKNIEWFSNEEILSGVAKSKGFIDVSNPRSTAVPKGIGGFSITKEDGVTYHYALPVYKTLEIELVGKKGEEQQKYSRSVNQGRAAITWLLTSITGPDFVDRGQIGFIDDQDWGYWLKFDYGTTNGEYWYRSPYYGYFDDNSSLSYSQGRREQYYLNSVETRSHKALFVKGVRTDGLSSYLKKSQAQSPTVHPTETGLSVPTPSLYLDEMILLSKTDFEGLRNIGFNEGVNSSLGVAGLLANSGNLGKLYDVADIQANASYRSYIDSRAVKRIKFVYENDETKKLCKKTLNSFGNFGNPPFVDATDIYAGKSGKLTLKRLQFFGRNSAKVFPDYKFEYGYNPDYNKDNWDGWGYYNPHGASTHGAAQDDQSAAAWSMTKVVLPTGGQIQVKYEADSYSKIGTDLLLGPTRNYLEDRGYQVTNADAKSLGELRIMDIQGIEVGDVLKVEGEVTYHCGSIPYNQPVKKAYSGEFTVKSINPNPYPQQIINFETNYMGITDCPTGGLVGIRGNKGKFNKVNFNKRGGGVRVAELSFSDEFGSVAKTKYSYVNTDNSSTGVVSKEPPYIKNSANPNNYGADNVYDYPTTSVLYSKVTVSNGYNKLTNNYSLKQVFAFTTPFKNAVLPSQVRHHDYLLPGFRLITNVGSGPVYLKQYTNFLNISTSRIGKLVSIKTYDKDDVLAESTTFDYTLSPPNDQGKYTSGSILSEVTSAGSDYTGDHVMKLIKTVKRYQPYVLSKITHTKDGFTTVKENKTWDFLTGIPLITETKSPGGRMTREEITLAYNSKATADGITFPLYGSMGLKGFDLSNKNMVSQTTGSYTYLLKPNGEVAGLLSANAQTWSSSWPNYRVYSATNQGYADNNEGPLVWRKDATYTWLGENGKVTPEGVRQFAPTDIFNYLSGDRLPWKKVSTINRYDHYSMPLEVTNYNNISSSTKMGYNDAYQILQATNANYHEVAFTSAEDLQSNNFFGGEVSKGLGTVESSPVHSGAASVSISSPSASSFVYKPVNLLPQRTYRASVWTTSLNGRIYYKINGSTEVLSAAPSNQQKVGAWYLINIEVPAQTSPFALEVGVKVIAPEKVYFDDFRFQPTDAIMTGYVFDKNTKSLTHVLDNENLFTHYEYNDKGEMVRVNRESIRYGIKKISETNNDFKRFYVD